MRTCDDIVREACSPRDLKSLHSCDHCAWARAGELLVGAIKASPETWRTRVDEAYDHLENAPFVLRREDLWSLVLLVEMPDGTADTVKRLVERETRGSRKLAFRENERIPILFGGFVGKREEDANLAAKSANVVEVTLAAFAGDDPELRQALEVLLKPRQPREEVDALIHTLSKEMSDAS